MELIRTIRNYSFGKVYTRLLFVILTLIGIIRGLQHYYVVDVFEPVQFGLWWHIPFNVFLWWLWLLFVPLLFWFFEKLLPIRGTALYWIIVCFLTPVLVVFLRQTVASLIIVEVLRGYRDFLPLLHMRLFSNIWIWLDYGMYFAIFVGLQIHQSYETGKHKEQRVFELQKQLAQSQLRALESQLHPHFLFNTLNTLSTLILKKDKQQAEHMLTLLHDFLKTTLKNDSRPEIPLKEELRYIQRYLTIERVRFQDRLTVDIACEKETQNAYIPRFLLQPLVENAIYHGIATKKKGGTITIRAKRNKNWLLLSVEDDGSGINPHKKQKQGVGLKITQERLKRIYGEKHRITWETPTNGGFRVFLTLPYHSETFDETPYVFQN